MPRPPGHVNRERILEVAAVEFAAHGLAGARIERVAASVALNVRMIYYHFDSKEALYRGVLARMLAHMAAVAPEHGIVPQDLDAPALRRLLEGFTAVCAADPTPTRLLLREVLDGGHHLRQVLAEHEGLTTRPIEAAARLVATGRRQGLVRDLLPSPAVVQVVTAAAFLVVNREALGLLTGKASSAAAWHEGVIDLLLGGLLAPATPRGQPVAKRPALKRPPVKRPGSAGRRRADPE
jgi:AcrR family transcriptional regulator